MVMAQQMRPGQLTAFPATAVAAQNDIGTLLTSIMPLIMIMMVFMMLTPMFKGMAKGFG
ncbi:hypothetical protein ES707_13079 [subsurface metagenome]